MRLSKDFGVKALFGVIILALGLPALVTMAVRGNDQALTTLGLIVMAVVSFFFGASTQKTANKGTEQ